MPWKCMVWQQLSPSKNKNTFKDEERLTKRIKNRIDKKNNKFLSKKQQQKENMSNKNNSNI